MVWARRCSDVENLDQGRQKCILSRWSRCSYYRSDFSFKISRTFSIMRFTSASLVSEALPLPTALRPSVAGSLTVALITNSRISIGIAALRILQRKPVEFQFQSFDQHFASFGVQFSHLPA